MTQLGLAFESAVLSTTSTPIGRAARRPDRRPQQVQQQQQTEEPSIAVDFTRDLSPEDMADVRAYADAVVPQLVDRAAAKYEDEEARDHHLLKYAAGLALTAARVLATVDRRQKGGKAPVASLAETEAPTRGPGRPRGLRAPGGPMPPPALRARPAVEGAVPVPAAPRKPQPTAEELLVKYRPEKPPAARARRAP